MLDAVLRSDDFLEAFADFLFWRGGSAGPHLLTPLFGADLDLFVLGHLLGG